MNLYEKYNLISEQGPPPGGGNPMAAMMGMMGGGGGKQGPPPSTEDQLFERVRSYPKIDAMIQQLQQKGVSDSRILDEIYTKFRPEFVYFAKEIILQENKPKPPAGPGGPGGMPGGMPGMPGGAGPVAEQFDGLDNDQVSLLRKHYPLSVWRNANKKNLEKIRATKFVSVPRDRDADRGPEEVSGGLGHGMYNPAYTGTFPRVPGLERSQDDARRAREDAKQAARKNRYGRGS